MIIFVTLLHKHFLTDKTGKTKILYHRFNPYSANPCVPLPYHIKMRGPGLKIRVRIGKLFYLFLIQNIYCGYSKERSQWDGSFEYPNTFQLMDKKIIAILRKLFLLNWPYEGLLQGRIIISNPLNWDQIIYLIRKASSVTWTSFRVSQNLKC